MAMPLGFGTMQLSGSIAYGHFGPDGREVAGEVTEGSMSIGRHMLIDGCWI